MAKQATLRDVASRVGVSVSVAGHVLNGGTGNSRASEHTARRIRQTAESLNYRPHIAACHLRGKRTHTFGLLVASAGDPQRALLVQQLDVEAVKIGCHTLIGNTIGLEEAGPDQFDYCVEEFARRGVDGTFCAVHRWCPGDRQALAAAHPNTVFYEDPGLPGATWAAPDREEAARMSVRHLAERGRRKIGLAILDLHWDYYQDRIDGHLDGLARCGLQPDRHLIHQSEWRSLVPELEHGVVCSFDYLKVLSDRAVDDLVRGRGADAIVAHDDYLAAALVKCLLRRGIAVPEDVAVVGFGNHILSPWTDRPLTTICLRQEVSAKKMVELLARMVTEGSPPADRRVVKVQPELIVRESA